MHQPNWIEIIPGFWGFTIPTIIRPCNPAPRSCNLVEGKNFPNCRNASGKLRSTITSETWDLEGSYPRLPVDTVSHTVSIYGKHHYGLVPKPSTITCEGYILLPTTNNHIIPQAISEPPIAIDPSWISVSANFAKYSSLINRRAIEPKAFTIDYYTLTPCITHVQVLKPLTPQEWDMLGYVSLSTSLTPYRAFSSISYGLNLKQPFSSEELGLTDTHLCNHSYSPQLLSAIVTNPSKFISLAPNYLKLYLPRGLSSSPDAELHLKEGLKFQAAQEFLAVYTLPAELIALGYVPYHYRRKDRASPIPQEIFQKILASDAILYNDPMATTVYERKPTKPKVIDSRLISVRQRLNDLGIPTATLSNSDLNEAAITLESYPDLAKYRQILPYIGNNPQLCAATLYPSITILNTKIPYYTIENAKQVYFNHYSKQLCDPQFNQDHTLLAIKHLLDNPHLFSQLQALRTLAST